jgi:antitoxin HicB
MKKSVTKKILSYTAIFEPAEEGGYVVSVPALPGCATQGETFEEATEMIKDAIDGYITVLKESGQEIPEENVIVTKVKIANPTTYL